MSRGQRPPPPVVYRQEVHWVPESRNVVIAGTEEPYRVWTLYGPGRDDPKVPPTLPITPVHHNGSFHEDKIHDWNCRKTDQGIVLRYASRAMDHSCWILVEYAKSVDAREGS